MSNRKRLSREFSFDLYNAGTITLEEYHRIQKKLDEQPKRKRAIPRIQSDVHNILYNANNHNREQ